MFSYTIIAFLFCFSIASLNALERCPGASDDSHEDLPWKYNASSIVTYGLVTEVNGDVVTFKVSCTLKGELTDSMIQFTQLSEVTNTSQCHYLTANKTYVIFLELSKTSTSNNKISYQLADMEEIKVTRNSVNTFIDEECNDEDDYGIPMTILYADSNNKCSQFTAICNENTKTSILDLSYAPLTKTSTFLGVMKKVLGIPATDADGKMISGKHSGSGDEMFRSTATSSRIFMSFVVIVTGFTMLFNI